MITASIVGATGYTGALLTDILSQHSEVRLQTLTSKSYVGRAVRDGGVTPAAIRRAAVSRSRRRRRAAWARPSAVATEVHGPET